MFHVGDRVRVTCVIIRSETTSRENADRWLGQVGTIGKIVEIDHLSHAPYKLSSGFYLEKDELILVV